MRGKMKVGVFLSVMLLPVLAGPTLAQPCPPKIPMTGINTDGHFPLDRICGLRITVYGSKPVNFYTGRRMPAAWLPPDIQPDPAHPGFWTITFGDPVNGPCFDRNDPIWWECGVFKGLHFGFYTDDPIVNLLNPNSSTWSQLGPPCVYFGPNGQEIPCSGLTSHSAGNAPLGVVQISNASVAAAFGAKAQGQALKIENVRVAVAPEMVAINDLGPCDLAHLAWTNVPLANSLLPASTEDGGVGTLNVTIPEHILDQEGWAVMVYDVTDPETGAVLTTSTLDFPLLGRKD